MGKIRITAPENLQEKLKEHLNDAGNYVQKNNIWVYESESKEIEFNQKCLDEVVGTIKYDGETGIFEEFKKRTDYDTKFVGLDEHKDYFKEIYRRILIILESPHKDEFGIDICDFASGDSVTARPANGSTGTNIDGYLAENLNKNIAEIQKIMGEKIDSSGVYSVSVMNAIPYQCSLGFNTIFYRDECFLKLWQQKKIRENFRARIKKINPDLIINACTLGDREEKEVKKTEEKKKKPKTEPLDLAFINAVAPNMIESYNQNKYPLNRYYYDEKDLENLETLKCLTLHNLVQHQIPDKYQEKTIHMVHPSSGHFKINKNNEQIIKTLYYKSYFFYLQKNQRIIKIKES